MIWLSLNLCLSHTFLQIAPTLSLAHILVAELRLCKEECGLQTWHSLFGKNKAQQNQIACHKVVRCLVSGYKQHE
jgi:hypothetical protein